MEPPSLPEGFSPLHLTSIPTRQGPPPSPTQLDVVGLAADGSPKVVTVGDPTHPTLLVFLSAQCQGCSDWFETLKGIRPPGLDANVEVVGVVATADDRGAMAELGVPVVESKSTWQHYRVHAAPFFVFVVDGRVLTEGLSMGVAGVIEHLRRATQK